MMSGDEINKVVVYGASDDLVEIEGAINEEWGYVSGDDDDEVRPMFLAFSDGTVLSIVYGCRTDGIWRINRVCRGSADYEKHEGMDEEKDYTDRVTLTGDIRWALLGEKLEKAKA